MVPFADLLAALERISDPRRRQGRRYSLAPPLLFTLEGACVPRRRQGRRYSLAHLLLFSVLAVLAGATSYRGILVFITVHRERLNTVFGAGLRRAPAVNTLRALFQALDPAELEAAFRQHARRLDDGVPAPGRRVIALDGKTLRRSFDHLNDEAAAHVLSAFACDAALILAHREVRDAPDEVPAARVLIEELGVRGALFTADALHCQKNVCERRPHRQRSPGPAQGQPARLA